MNLTVIVVGRSRGVVGKAVADYEERAGRYWKLEVVEVEAGAPGRSPAPGRVRSAEGERILDRLPSPGEVLALTRKGRPMGSAELARHLQERALHSAPAVCFVVGGAFGLSPEVLGRADRHVSLSELTLPHEIARLLLAEQLYRAGTILRGEPYHKGGG